MIVAEFTVGSFRFCIDSAEGNVRINRASPLTANVGIDLPTQAQRAYRIASALVDVPLTWTTGDKNERRFLTVLEAIQHLGTGATDSGEAVHRLVKAQAFAGHGLHQV